MILVDHRARFLAGREAEFARRACARREGIGADGVILLEIGAGADSELFVRFFNPDGGEYGLCGNGARCVPAFAKELGIGADVLKFRSHSGVHEGRVTGAERARVTLSPIREIRLDLPVDVDGVPKTIDWGDIGVPHAVLWVDDVNRVPIERWGPHLRSHRTFAPDGSNVSFAQVVSPGRIRIRTFERGVEGETLACGSGSAVCAAIARERAFASDRVLFEVRSGAELVIDLPLRETSGPPALEGPVHRAFQGVIDFVPAPAGEPAAHG